MVESKRLAGTALAPILDPETDPVKAAQLSLAIIREADPPAQASVELRADLTPEDVEKLSWSEAIALARQLGMELPGDDLQLPAGSS
jgi:hypothetical protein